MTATKTITQLADGRTLIYFDEKPGEARGAVDQRDLPETATHSQVRWDPIQDDWVVIASHRQGRTFLPPADQCPLCPSRDGRMTEIPAADYDVAVFDNRFPSLSPETQAEASSDGLFIAGPGNGKCEVVCFTSDHNSSFSQLTQERAETVIEAWVDRTQEMSTMDSVEQVFPFENRGQEIGVTLAHPHGQIYAYPFLPPPIKRMLESARKHRNEHDGCLFCDVLEAERSAGERIVVEGDHWTAFVPYAARWPYEVHLYARRHVPDLPALTAAERSDLARVYLEVLRRFDALFQAPTPYIAAWMQAPVRIDRDLAHLHLKVFTIRRAEGKLKYLAGSESGMGVFINDVTPEQAAARLRGEG
ncbi:MAG TPA: galactose-1-phosphate uridylyltransferase [Mycobacteriales bacterium]|nr:galactose-1-phosphate uridylyltransferase [Mycobacteriales bacterium]